MAAHSHRPSSPVDPDIVVTTPGGLVACVPYLVGFVPTESLVLVFLSPPPREIAVTLRMDLPPDTGDRGPADDDSGVGAEPVREVVSTLAAALDRALASNVTLDQVHLMIFSSLACRRPHGKLLRGVAEVCAARGVDVGQQLAVHGDRMWTYDCPDEACCPVEGLPVVDDASTRAVFSLVSAGVGYVPDRATLEQSVLPDADGAVAPAELEEARCARDEAEQRGRGARWRRRVEDGLAGSVRTHFDEAKLRDQAAVWAVGLADSRVREPFMYRLLVALSGDVRRRRLQLAREWLTALVRMLDGPEVAPAAATLAALVWQAGDGAFAVIAAQRALAADPDNRLASLINAAAGSGLPPRQWTEVLGTFTLAGLRRPSACASGPAA